MGSGDILRMLRRRGWIVLLLMLLTAGAAYGFSKTQRTLYRSMVEVLIQPARADLSVTQTAKQLLASYSAYIDSERIAQKVLDQLQLDMQASELKSMVTVDPDENRLVISIAVKDPEEGQANRIARAWAEQLVQWRNAQNQELLKENRIEAVIRDEPKASLYQPQTKINVAAGAVLGLLLGAVLVFALEWIESGIVRHPADLERFVGLTALGAIPHTRPQPGARRLPTPGSAPAARRSA